MEGITAPPFDLDSVVNVSNGSIFPDLKTILFRDPDSFVAGQLHKHVDCWEEIIHFAPYDEAYDVLDWIKNTFAILSTVNKDE
jgi:hypothetical protein